MITATRAEHDSIVDPQSNYILSSKEVVLTGFPRHDRLLSLPRSATTLLVMPTWRRYLLKKDKLNRFVSRVWQYVASVGSRYYARQR